MYRIEYTPYAEKRLDKLPERIQQQIYRKLDLLSQDPYAPNNNVRKLSGREGYRLRVGDYRVIYRLFNDKVLILVTDAAHRKEVYQ